MHVLTFHLLILKLYLLLIHLYWFRIHFEDLQPGDELEGTVRNIIDFGAFVDIGVHQDGLVHISQLSNGYVKHPLDIVKIGQIVKVKVISVDVDKKKIGLSMKEVNK